MSSTIFSSSLYGVLTRLSSFRYRLCSSCRLALALGCIGGDLLRQGLDLGIRGARLTKSRGGGG
jgi:hypothetical protein